MGAIIISQPGQVVAIPIPNDNPMPLSVTGWEGAGSFKAIITEMQMAQRDKFSAIQTLDQLVYIYSFGRELGQLRIGGIAFNAGCSDDVTTGIEYVQGFYNQYSITAQPDPLTIVMGTSDLGIHTGYLIGFDINIMRPESRLAFFGLQFLLMPAVRNTSKNTSSNSSGGSGSST